MDFTWPENWLIRVYQVTGLDIINDYYDVNLKYDRLEHSGISRDQIEYNTTCHKLQVMKTTSLFSLNLKTGMRLFELFAKQKFDVVVNLAAQAGVRYSLTHPQAYVDSNITGFLNILEACRHHPGGKPDLCQQLQCLWPE